MDDTSGYQGWKNYPTWAVNLWLSNDEALYETTTEMAFWCKAQNRSLSDGLKTWVMDDLAPDLGASFASDLLGYALDQVDWDAIAEAWLSEVEPVS